MVWFFFVYLFYKQNEMTMEAIIDRVYWDIKQNPKSYTKDFIETDGIPYWEGEVANHPSAQKIIDLYRELITPVYDEKMEMFYYRCSW